MNNSYMAAANISNSHAPTTWISSVNLISFTLKLQHYFLEKMKCFTVEVSHSGTGEKLSIFQHSQST